MTIDIDYKPCKWGTDDLFGPGIDSRNRVYVLLDLIDAATSREQVWRLFQRGWSNCDAIDAFALCDLLAVLSPQLPYGTEFLEGEDAEFFAALPEKVTIYRGCTPHGKEGLAWTTNVEIAEFFAKGHRGIRVPDGRVYRAKVDKRDILTVLTERKEDEVVVDPRALSSIRKFKKVA